MGNEKEDLHDSVRDPHPPYHRCGSRSGGRSGRDRRET